MAFAAMLRYLTKIIPSGMAVPIFRGPLRGARWIAGAAAGEGKGLSVIANLAEPEQLDRAARLASPETVFFDIGANAGLYTLLMARRCKHVYAFEPVPRNIRYLSRAVDINRLDNVTIVPCAVAERTGLTFFAMGTNCATGRLAEGGSQPVMTVSCDEFVERCGVVPSVLKIDVEGGEMTVLRGAQRLLRSKPAILLSIHSDALREECLGYLRENGYTKIMPLDRPDEAAATEFAIGE